MTIKGSPNSKPWVYLAHVTKLVDILTLLKYTRNLQMGCKESQPSLSVFNGMHLCTVKAKEGLGLVKYFAGSSGLLKDGK